MKTKIKLTLSQYLSLKNINQKDFLTGKSQSDLENISRLVGVSLDLKPLEKKPEASVPVKIDIPTKTKTEEVEFKSYIEKVVKEHKQEEESIFVENKTDSEEVVGHVSKLLQFVKEVAENSDSSEYSKEYMESTSKKRKKN